jgi:VPDSG-CTERM motif
MKALPKKLLRLTLFAIAVTSLICVRPAEAYTVTLHQAGSNVVANGSGAIDLTGLTFSSTQSAGPFINPSLPGIRVGADAPCDVWDGIAGPTSFGSGGVTLGAIGIGDLVGLSTNELNVPQGYVSGTTLTTSSATFNNATFASLGVTPGTYVWSWGTGLPNQNFTLIIGGAGVPDGGSTVSLLGFALLGLTALRRKLPLLRGTKS